MKVKDLQIHNTTMPDKFKVEIREYEKGWGSKTDEIKDFDTQKEADDFISEFNSKNTEDVVPDWYMIALKNNY